MKTYNSPLSGFKITLVFYRRGILARVVHWDRKRILAERSVSCIYLLFLGCLLQLLQGTLAISSFSVGINLIELASTKSNCTGQTCIELSNCTGQTCVDSRGRDNISNCLCFNIIFSFPNQKAPFDKKNALLLPYLF